VWGVLLGFCCCGLIEGWLVMDDDVGVCDGCDLGYVIEGYDCYGKFIWV